MRRSLRIRRSGRCRGLGAGVTGLRCRRSTVLGRGSRRDSGAVGARARGLVAGGGGRRKPRRWIRGCGLRTFRPARRSVLRGDARGCSLGSSAPRGGRAATRGTALRCGGGHCGMRRRPVRGTLDVVGLVVGFVAGSGAPPGRHLAGRPDRVSGRGSAGSPGTARQRGAAIAIGGFPGVGPQSGLRLHRAAQIDAVVEHLLDHLEWQEVVTLLTQDPPQPLDVGAVELPVAGAGALGGDQTLALEEPDLRDRDVREVLLHQRQDLADRQVIGRSGLTHAEPPRVPMTKTNRNLPTCSCEPSRSRAWVMRSPSR